MGAVGDCFASIIGGDAGLRLSVEKARRLGEVDSPVLLQGETGVGKELFARVRFTTAGTAPGHSSR